MAKKSKNENVAKEKKKKVSQKEKWLTGVAQYRDVEGLVPSVKSPICEKCGLDKLGCSSPYIDYAGAEDPIITLIVEGVSKKEDEDGKVGESGGWTGYLLEKFEQCGVDGFDAGRIRVVPATRCASTQKINLGTRANWCRTYLVDDLKKHRPKLIVPVGSMPLGLLVQESNAQDWGGKLLAYRGWPDDWLTNPAFDEHHPVFGPRPTRDDFVPLFPIQSPGLIQATQNREVLGTWMQQIRDATKLAIGSPKVMSYTRPWYRLTTDLQIIIDELAWLAKNPGTLVTYDTETTGLKQFAQGQKIVMMMFRWVRDKQPVSLAFPWDYEGSELIGSLDLLTPYVLAALYNSRVQGHNLAFDILFTFATLKGADLHRLTSAMHADTMHLLYTLKQRTGSLGLELMAFNWVPDLAGYEKEMSLLIERYDSMNPKKGGHYANCPKHLWATALEPYVLGDVEVCHQAARTLRKEIQATETWRIPLAHPKKPGKFRWFTTPSRDDVYNRVMRPANRLLTRMMGRGMKIDKDELSTQEDLLPKQIITARKTIRESSEKIILWAEQMEATKDDWHFDLENKEQLKTVLFDLLGLPVINLTKTGKKMFGETADKWKKLSREIIMKYAAVDKFTLNSLAASHAEVRPLQEYRKLYKQYTGFIRPIRNFFAPGVDKKPRTGIQHLMPDDCIHGQFVMTGTRAGRLSSREPNLQNLPKEGTFKRVIVSRFGKDGCLYGSDLSQIELRLTAAACGDKAMVQAYRKNLDLHALTQSKIYNRPYEECTKKWSEKLQKEGRHELVKQLDIERRVSKIVNFLTSYGGGAQGLMSVLAAQQVYKTLDECRDIIDSFFNAYPSLKDLIAVYKKFIYDNGCAVSILGRVRWFDDVYSEDSQLSSKALRAGVNHLIQSTASDMMLLTLCYIEEKMREAGLESIIISTVHDSLLIDTKIDELDKVHAIVNTAMNDIPTVLRYWFGDDYDTSWMLIPFEGDGDVGYNYSDNVKIPSSDVDWSELLKRSAH